MKADRYRGLAPYLGIALATAFVLVFVLKLPFARLDVPYTFEGDDIDKIAQIQTVAETGWASTTTVWATRSNTTASTFRASIRSTTRSWGRSRR